MTDILIIPNRWNEQALVNPTTKAGERWLSEFILVDEDGAVTLSLEGAREVEREATRDGLMVESR